MLQKANISLTSHNFFAHLNVKTLQWEEIGLSPFIGRKCMRFETGFSVAVFSKAPKVEFTEQGPRSAGSVSTTAKNEGLVPR